MSNTYRLGIDIGGTFTDFALQQIASGEMTYWKSLTTPSEPWRGAIQGVTDLLAHSGVSWTQISEIIHGTTVAANAIIERKGSRVGLITTVGMRDVILVGRQKRYEMYNFTFDKPQPLVEREDICEVNERIDHRGRVLTPLMDEEVGDVVKAMVEQGIESFAVCLLHAYANPIHEQRVAELIEERFPDIPVSLSTAVSPKYREYERTSTTVANAFVKPVMREYLRSLKHHLSDHGFRGQLYIMQSNGGLATSEIAAEFPIRVVESGPTAGVLSANARSQQCGLANLIAFDMGGTTAKACLIEQNTLAMTSLFEIDRLGFKSDSGLPLNIPAVDLIEIGAGGGSIGRLKSGILQVGPESAAANPGPVCYGLGGIEPTVTDANLLLGYLNPGYFLGGKMQLHGEVAQRAVAEHVGIPLNVTALEAAWGIHELANSNMERAISMISVERGRDPRDFTLVASGGAGPLHANRLAHNLNIPRVLIPAGAGVGSAIGLLLADVKFDLLTTRVLVLTAAALEEIAAVLSQVEADLTTMIKNARPGAPYTLQRYAMVRYRGQGHEIRVDLPTGPVNESFVEAAVEAFQKTYAREYGYVAPDALIEVVDWGVTAWSAREKPAAGDQLAGTRHGEVARKGVRKAYFPEYGGLVECPTYDRYGLPPGQVFEGPAVVEEVECTTVVLPGYTFRADAVGNLLITAKGSAFDVR